MSDPQHAPVPKFLIPGLAAALIAWGLYLAIGAAFPEVGPSPAERQAAETAEAGAETSPAAAANTRTAATPEAASQTAEPLAQRTDWANFRPWRGLVVLVCSAFFLIWFWGLQKLYVRRHQQQS